MTQAPEEAPNVVDAEAPAHASSSGRWQGWLSVFGIAGLAVGLPLFRVLGPHPEFFLAHRVGRIGVVVFAVLAAAVIPAAVATLATLAGHRSPTARSVIVAVVATVAVAGLAQALAGFVFFPVVVVAGGVLVTVWERNSEAFRSGLAVAAVMSLLSGGWFLGASRTSTYVFSSDADAIEIGATPEDLPPVVFLVFDEFPAPALLNSDLEINAERFPNFARLADQSHWFWRASSVSPQTSSSVPALWSGTEVTDAVAIASNYPSNLFRQLGGAYEVFAYEPITALCPGSVCGAEATAPTAERSRPESDLGQLLRDTAVVYGHAVGSDSIRGDLPAIDHSWSGFGANLVPVGSDSQPDEYGQLGHEATFAGASTQLKMLVENRPTADRPPLYAAHLLAPHLPYMSNPDGTFYDPQDLVGMETSNGGLVWPEPDSNDSSAVASSEAHRRQGYQRLVFQLGALDRLLGDTIASLEAAGVWDDAVVVVTADHGATFEPGPFRSIAHGGAEVWNVPLFVKAPGQTEGQRRDEAALTIDALPTLMGLVGLPPDDEFDGVDLLSGDVPDSRGDAYVDENGAHTVDQSGDAIAELVQRRAGWFSPDGGWDEVLSAGPGGEHVGGPVPAELGPVAGSWSASVSESGTIRSLQAFDLTFDPGVPVPSGVLIAVGGEIVGAGSPVVASGSGYRVWALSDPAVSTATADNVTMYTVGPDDTLSPLTYSP